MANTLEESAKETCEFEQTCQTDYNSSKDLLVRRVYSKNGIDVVVQIDFIKREVSLTDRDGNKKQWLFHARSSQYLNGWKAILSAMDHAISEAQKELDVFNKKEHDDFIKLYMKLDRALNV